MYLVSSIYRNPSNGSEKWYTKTFVTLDEASQYISTEWYDNLCEINDYPSEWDESEFGCPMPLRNSFSIEAIKARKSKVLFAPYNTYYSIIPNELRIEESKSN